MDHVIVRNYLYKVRLNTIIDKVEDKDKIPTRITNKLGLSCAKLRAN